MLARISEGTDFKPEFVAMINALVACNIEDAKVNLHKAVGDAELSAIKVRSAKKIAQLAKSGLPSPIYEFFETSKILLDKHIYKLVEADGIQANDELKTKKEADVEEIVERRNKDINKIKSINGTRKKSTLDRLQ